MTARPTCAFGLWLALLAGQALWLPAGAVADTPEKRQVPDYDGREEPTTAGDVLIWVPRVVLSPLYLISEYVIRRPLGFLLTAAERSNVPAFLYDLFTFGPKSNAGLVPTFFFEFGFEPSIGLYLFWNDAFADGHDLMLRAATWGDQWLAAAASSRHRIGEDTFVRIRASGVRRPDYRFYGEGPRSLEEDGSRYGAITFEGAVDLDSGWGRAGRVRAEVGVRKRRFLTGSFRGEPSVPDQVQAGVYDAPDGYEDGYTILYNRMLLALDSRPRAPAPGTGVRLELRAEQGSELIQEPNAYLRYSAIFGGYLDLNDRRRVVSLYYGVAFSDPLQGEVPFTELAALGGDEVLRGFVAGRLYGRSATGVTLQYRWPVWVKLDGSIQLALGNVFGEHLQDFEWDLLRFSGAIGIQSVGSRDSSIEILFGIGSETFEQGGAITSFRFVFGTHYGF